ncbi:uncharacterized protein A1O5_08495 [Cladophialophora psammophila CBS 110553]|uniref:Uncharacterized protein n=1 Tax=Cladophialophora psammophila CBS 110553 TaxID=1182543 RepID=W9WVL7_9EURO|nr:uncharacterized protein A1O5_08495 [Cladophialophora psammophila CBS 110553]EXJ68701.1 hypothetical protein A1O5_08495 [Cladophialophora psammophila CBS 110553]
MQRRPLDHTASAPPSPFGAFSMLPPEIRNLIYAECVRQRSTGLLRASKRLYAESLPHYRRKFVLSFHIDPQDADPGIPIFNRDGCPWGDSENSDAINTIDVSSVHPDTELLDTMPIDQFGQIRIVIGAPDIRDRGQFMRCWYRVKRLLAALLPQWRDPNKLPESPWEIVIPWARQSTALPPIVVEFRECVWSERGRWGQWNQNIPFCHAFADGILLATQKGGGAEKDKNHYRSSNIAHILQLFFRVRNAASLTVKLPPSLPKSENKRLWHFIERLQEYAVSEIPFGMDFRGSFPVPGGRDGAILSCENADHIWLDYCLTRVDSEASSGLKLERMENWCLEYERDLARASFGYLAHDERRGQLVRIGVGRHLIKWASFGQAHDENFRQQFWSWVSHYTEYNNEYSIPPLGLNAEGLGDFHAFIIVRHQLLVDRILGFPIIGKSVDSRGFWERDNRCRRCLPYRGRRV